MTQRQKRVKREVCWTKGVLGRQERCLRGFLFNDLDFLRKEKDGTIGEEKGLRDKERTGKVENR